MYYKKENKEPTTLHTAAATIFPYIFISYKNGDAGHLYNINNTNDNSLQAIDKKDLFGIPAFKPNAIQGNQINNY